MPKFLLLILLVLPLCAAAQTKLDSLYAVWQDAEQADSNRINAYYEYIWNGYLFSRPDTAEIMAELLHTYAREHQSLWASASGYKLQGIANSIQGKDTRALEYFHKRLAIAEEIGNKSVISNSLGNIGKVYRKQGDYPRALEYYQRNLAIQEEIGDKPGSSYTLVDIGSIYLSQGNHSRALEYYQKGLAIQEEIGDKPGIANCLSNIGVIYKKQGDHSRALEYYQKSLAIAEEIGNKYAISNCLNNIGILYGKQGIYPRALEYFQKGLAIKEETGDRIGIANSLHNIGAIYKDQGNYPRALEYHQKSLTIREEMGDKSGIASSLTNIGRTYYSQGSNSLASTYCQKGLTMAEEIDNLEFQMLACDCLYDSYKAKGQTGRALSYYELWVTLHDSLFSEENTKEITRLEVQYEYEKQALADSLAFVAQQADTEVAYQRQLAQRNYLLFGGLGLAALGLVFFRLRQQRKAREQALVLERERSDKLEQIDKLKDQFLANTSHELRTPLNGIIGLTEGLLEEADDPDTRQHLGMVVASGKRLASLVNDLLDFSRIRNADLVLRQRPVHLRSLVEVILQISYTLTQGKDLKLQNEISPDLPAAFADEDRLTQILHNLVGNAIKFTETGYVRVEATEKSGQLQINIIDTGIGIPEDKREAIFQEFVQADGSIARTYAGTGLGLSISRYLVEQHGGQMWVESEAGHGSTFSFTLPLSTEKAAPLVRSAPGLTPLIPEASDGTGVLQQMMQAHTGNDPRTHLLIVDDEPINHQVLKKHLKSDRFMVSSAMNGHEALEMIKAAEQPFDLILLDVMMPRMSGYEVAQKVRETYLPSELPIIMVTAKNQVADLVQGLNTGANDYLAKPFSKDEFLARLGTHLNLQQINTATRRFVPEEFIRTLGRNTITEVSAGDHIDQEVTVFFSDIRGYTGLAEGMSPEENFQFVNAYARRMGPIIRTHQGFVNQYLGDAIMAIFRQAPRDALQAAIAMQTELRRYNQQRLEVGRQPLRVGMGLHTGPLVMGIIGDQYRSEAAVIADTVNTAARLEGLTKYYGANILLSEISYANLDMNQQESCRYLGLVRVKGRKEPLGIYECMAGDESSMQEYKRYRRLAFGEALGAFIRGDMDLAVQGFNALASASDLAAQRLLTQALYYSTEGLPAEWMGVEVMEGK